MVTQHAYMLTYFNGKTNPNNYDIQKIIRSTDWLPTAYDEPMNE